MKKLAIIFLAILFSASVLYAYSWSGTYYWDNPTEDDNDGRVESLEFQVVDSATPWKREIWFIDGNERHRIFPFILPTDKESFEEWHKFGEKSTEAETFRYNTKKMNKTTMTPGKWKMEEVVSSENESVSIITVGAFSFKIGITTSFSFSLDEKGKEQLTFGMDVDKGYAKGMFFTNPEPESGGLFILKKK